jgi:hypothetical protein
MLLPKEVPRRFLIETAVVKTVALLAAVIKAAV